MNIAIIGSGGREHALCQKFSESKKINRIFCLPGNAGTSTIATNIEIDLLDFKGLVLEDCVNLAFFCKSEPLKTCKLTNLPNKPNIINIQIE